MNAPTPHSVGWPWGRFLAVTLVLFAFQAGLVLLFAERARPSPRMPAGGTVFRLLGAPLDEAGLSKYIFATDPAIFPGSSIHGFADQAWERVPPVEYHKATNNIESPAFLEFTAKPPAAAMGPASPIEEQIPFELAANPFSIGELAPAIPSGDGSRRVSFFRIAGALQGRQMDGVIPLQEWASSGVLSNTVVRFAVTRAGQVVSARLWESCGLPEADASAIAEVSGMRFSTAGKSSNELEWGTATFFWRTIEPPAATNAVPGIMPEPAGQP